jgi:GLPGLI family protein
MKNILLLNIFIFICLQTNAQRVEAHYIVRQPIQIPFSKEKIKEFNVEYEGLIYQSGPQSICYLIPQYLKEYPKGEISIPLQEGSTLLKLSVDSIQQIQLYNTDSLRLWRCNNSSSDGYKQYSTLKFKIGMIQWKILPETKTINGLLCKHAQQVYNETIYNDVWYYPQVPLQYGFLGLRDAPGLIVECSSPLANIFYSLKYFKTDEPIDDTVFWPAIFNKAKFEEMSPAAKPVNDAKKSAIMNEQ